MQTALMSSLALAVAMVGCAGSAATTPAEPGTPGNHTEPAQAQVPAQPAAESQPATPAQPADPRESLLAQINEAAYGDDVGSAYDRARIVAAGLSEEAMGLHPSQSKALAAVVSPRIDPSPCPMIIREAIRESALKAVDKRCGGFADLEAQVSAAPAQSQAGLMAKRCKLQPDPQLKLEGINPWALLISDLVLAQLGGSASKDAQRSSQALAYVCSPGAV